MYRQHLWSNIKSRQYIYINSTHTHTHKKITHARTHVNTRMPPPPLHTHCTHSYACAQVNCHCFFLLNFQLLCVEVKMYFCCSRFSFRISRESETPNQSVSRMAAFLLTLTLSMFLLLCPARLVEVRVLVCACVVLCCVVLCCVVCVCVCECECMCD